jgi:hypothetical protein
MLMAVLAVSWPSSARAQAPTFAAVCDATSEDTDRDGTSDACELEFAVRVAPILVVHPAGCNWDGDSNRIGGGYFFGVQRVDSVMRIAYLPAYFRDCGWSGIKCWLPQVDCSPHDGDSEFIVVDAVPKADDSWTVGGIFLSSHCFGRYGKACRWYRGDELEKFKFNGPSPMIWVAEGRNANYASARDCDRGLHSIDTCDRNTSTYSFPVDARRNIGSRDVPALPGGCIDSKELAGGYVAEGASECFWRLDRPFAGWQKGSPGVTPYARYLYEIAGF